MKYAFSFIGVVLAASLLVACSNDAEKNNPLRESPYAARYARALQGFFSNRNDAVCPFYFANPSDYLKEKQSCDAWIAKFKPFAQKDVDAMRKHAGKPPIVLTDADCRDPVFWKKVTEAMPNPDDAGEYRDSGH